MPFRTLPFSDGAADLDPILLRASLPVLLSAWLLSRPLDIPAAQLLFDWQGGHWALRHDLLLETLLHRGGHHLSLFAWLSLFGATLLHWRRSAEQPWVAPAAWLLLSVAVSTLVVAWLKRVTHMDCPWDLTIFGGSHLFVPLFAWRSPGLGQPACFPAAHAASGYAWVALYFFFAAVRPSWRRAGLVIGLLSGLVFGIAQQLRGAHFLSHDIASLAVCWAVAGAVACLARWCEQSPAEEAA